MRTTSDRPSHLNSQRPGSVREQPRADIPPLCAARLASSAVRFDVCCDPSSQGPVAHPAVPELGVTLVAATEGSLTVIDPTGNTISGTLLAFGPSLRPRVVLPGPRLVGTHVTLTPEGVRLLFGVKMSELADAVVHVRELPTTMELDEDNPMGVRPLAATSQPRSRSFDLVMRWWSRLGSESAQPLDSVAASAGISPRRVRDLVASELGLTPKGWHRLARHQRARRLVRMGHALACAAAEAGYADQPHMQREWRAFSLQTPAASTRSEYLPLAELHATADDAMR